MRNYVPPSKPEVEDAPDWAKRLWKGIAKKCHPDRLSFLELTAIQIARRQTWFLEAKSLFEQRLWNRLLHIGVQVDEYVEDLPASLQLKMINDEYNSVTSKVEEIQKSLAWKWGTNWSNVDLRTKILTVVLQSEGIQVPPKLELIKVLVNFESE